MSRIRVNEIGGLTGQLMHPLAGRATTLLSFYVTGNAVNSITGENIASVVRENNARYIVNLQTPYATDLFFPFCSAVQPNVSGGSNYSAFFREVSQNSLTIVTQYGNGTLAEPTRVFMAVYGELQS